MQFQEGYHTYYIYIISNTAKTVLYTGVTNNLKIRLEQHKDNIVSKNKTFASSYNVHFYFIMKNLLGFKKLLQGKKKLKAGEEKRN